VGRQPGLLPPHPGAGQLSAAAAVVSYNTRELLRACLASVRDAGAAEIVVVDNGSRDGSVEMVRAEFPEARLVLDPSNRGYGAAANLAFRRSTAEHLLLLNSDTTVSPGACRALAAYLDAHPRVGLAGPLLRNPDGTLQRSCFPFPSPRTAFLGESGLGYGIRFVPGLRARHPRTWAHDRPRPMPWVLGAALGIRRAAFDAVGGFDERFFMYFEEVDLCRRLAGAGWEVHFAPVTEVTHLGGASTSQARAEMIVRYYESMARFYRFHRPAGDLARLRAIVRAKARVALLRDRARLAVAPGHARAALAERITAWRRLLREPWTEAPPRA